MTDMGDVLDFLRIQKNEDGSYTLLVRVQLTVRDMNEVRQNLLPQMSHPDAGLPILDDETVLTQAAARIIARAPGWRESGLRIRWTNATIGETQASSGPNSGRL